ncbi:MAG TPA: PQQ-dependent sugar dehydrogenase [Thermoanaerobaculia bacterium]|nr:PQQ-dependent sugar dehydrogenase [Thermoanaerobaculia bacterium]
MYRAPESTPISLFFLFSATLLLALPLVATPAPATGPFAVAGQLPGVVLEPVATGLGPLTSITHAGDNRLFLTTKDGRVLILDNGVVRSELFLDLRGQVSTDEERGVLSLAFHPDYVENGLFFIVYTNLDGTILLVRYQLAADDPNHADPASARILLAIAKTTSQHHGGQLHFGPDGYLYMSVGDNAGRVPADACVAQEGDSLLGKLLRLDVDHGADAPPYYSIPFDNPFRGTGTARDEVWALGFRNPWRFSFDRVIGDMWIGDVGQSTIEEVDLLPAGTSGQNFGWKLMEGTACFREVSCPADVPPCGSPLFTLPVLEYEHSDENGCSVTGGYVYRGKLLPQLYGTYVFGDFCTGNVWGAVQRPAGLQVRELRAAAPLLTTFGQDAAGELYAATIGGTLYRLAARGPVDTVAVYSPSEARFLFSDLHLSGLPDKSLRFGTPGNSAVPLAGDWNGDGKTTIGTWEPATGRFRLKSTLTRGPANVTFVLPARSGAIPLAGDWNGDGRDSVGYYDPATATFQLRNALSAGKLDVTLRYGTPGNAWLPITGDWNGDGRDTVGLYDPATSTFHLKNTFKGGNDNLTIQLGPAGSNWLPLAGDWDGDGRDGIGLYDPETGVFRLKNALRSGAADYVFQFGPVAGGGVPLVGEW